MANTHPIDDEPMALEARLRALHPVDAPGRDLLLFRAGQQQAARRARWWQLAGTAVACALLGITAVGALRPRTRVVERVVERVVYVEREVAPPRAPLAAPEPRALAATQPSPPAELWALVGFAPEGPAPSGYEFSNQRLLGQVIEHGIDALPARPGGGGARAQVPATMGQMLRQRSAWLGDSGNGES